MSVSLTVMTFNLLEDQPEDSPNSWGKRRDLCPSVITNYSPMILCTQQGYDQFGISRKGSEDTSDEHCTIFYDKEKVELFGCRSPHQLLEAYHGDVKFRASQPGRQHGVVGDMRDAWPDATVRKNVSLIRTYHGFKGNKQGALEFLELIFRAFCLCWDRRTQDLHVDWILFRGRTLIPVSSEVVSDNIDGYYPSSHYPIFAEFMLPRSIRLLEATAQDVN